MNWLILSFSLTYTSTKRKYSIFAYKYILICSDVGKQTS